MLLSDKDIARLISSGELKIQHNTIIDLKSASICLHLSNKLRVFSDKQYEIDIRLEETYPHSRSIEVDTITGYSINPGDFLLASTTEEISLPNSVAGVLSNISGLARLGLNTILSTYVSPGYGKNTPKPITLELHNISKSKIRIYPGMRICHLLLSSLQTNTTKGYDQLHPEKYITMAPQGSEYFKNTGLPSRE